MQRQAVSLSAAAMANPSTAASDVEESVWRAIAGSSVIAASRNSYIYYFPQGHLEHSSPSASYSGDANDYNFTLLRPWIPCQVLSVRFLADAVTDQAYVRYLLQPLQPLGPRPRNGDVDYVRNDDIASFTKVLTRSDANNGGGFSVPRFCADMILPHLDFTADPPVQNVVMRDAHNHAWVFRHIYRGTPRRHLLTTGWSKFVNAKRLVAGDAVVFIRRRSTGELFVGVRRAQRFAGGGDGGRIRAEALAAIGTASRGMPFEVVYHPRSRVPEFVVYAEKVKEALRQRWMEGVRVQMWVERNDSCRLRLIQGSISSIHMPDSGMWIASPWRMLQVNWDDVDATPESSRVSPWQVEMVQRIHHIVLDHPPPKRRRLGESGSQPDRARNDGAGPSSSTMNTPELNHPPAGFQGNRLDQASTSRQPPPNQGVAPATAAQSVGSSCSDTVTPPRGQLGQVSWVFQLFGTRIEMARPRDGGGGKKGS